MNVPLSSLVTQKPNITRVPFSEHLIQRLLKDIHLGCCNTDSPVECHCRMTKDDTDHREQLALKLTWLDLLSLTLKVACTVV